MRGLQLLIKGYLSTWQHLLNAKGIVTKNKPSRYRIPADLRLTSARAARDI